MPQARERERPYCWEGREPGKPPQRPPLSWASVLSDSPAGKEVEGRLMGMAGRKACAKALRPGKGPEGKEGMEVRLLLSRLGWPAKERGPLKPGQGVAHAWTATTPWD